MARVYSTDQGRLCPTCNHPLSQCRCRTQRAAQRLEGDGTVRLRRESKGRKGKGVTLVEGIPGTEEELKALAKELKRQLGSGGSVKEGTLEFQGEQREKLRELLSRRGFRVKFAGG